MRVNRAWLGLAVLVLPTLLVAMDITALFLALPQLSADLGATNVQQLWISDGYGFMVAGLVITMGTLGDRIGRRRLLLIGGAAFAVVSVRGRLRDRGSVPPERAGSAASMSETGNYLGGSLGAALLGVVAAVVYQSRMSAFTGSPAAASGSSAVVSGPPPAGTGSLIGSSGAPADPSGALAGVSDSLAGAIAAAPGLPAGQAATLLHAAREAFTAGVHVTGAVSTVVFAGLAVLIVAMRPAAPPAPAARPDHEATTRP